MQSISMKKLSAVALLLTTTIMYSCDKDDETSNVADEQIRASEAMTIPDAVTLPANAPSGNERVATYYAVGVQKYKAQVKAGSAPVTFEWVFVAPEAKLFNNQNQQVGTHSAGPSWRLTGGIDSMYGQQFTPARTAPAPVASSIDWLLLMPKDGKTPTGIFADVSYIQRIATSGGKAPSTLPVTENDKVEVPYTAVYRFSKKKQ